MRKRGVCSSESLIYDVQCLKKLIKCFILLHCFNNILMPKLYYIMYLGLFESPQL